MGNNNANAPVEENKNNEKKLILYYSNNERYEGEVVDRVRHGFGIYYYQNEDRYEGMWFRNMKQGNGSYFYQNGEVYEGWWQNNQKDKLGTQYYNNGDRYYGEWKNNKRNGKGIVHSEDGSKFVGHFKNNKKNGIGELHKNGEIIYQEWKDGKFVREIEKLKDNIKDIDYNQFRTNDFEKFLGSMAKKDIEYKSKMIKSKYFPLEVAKTLKSKNPDNFYDSMLTLQKSNINAKKDFEVENWTVEDVSNWLTKLGLIEANKVVNQLQLSGKKLLAIDFERLIELLNVTDNRTKNILFHTIMYRQQKSKMTTQGGNPAIGDIKSKKSFNNDDQLSGDSANINMNLNAKMNPELTGHAKKEETFIEEEEKDAYSDEGVTTNRENKKEKGKDDSSDNDEDLQADTLLDKEANLKMQQDLFLKSKNVSFGVNLTGLNFFIDYNEITLVKKVGEGGFGEVYQGLWNGKKVAVKILTIKHTKYKDNMDKLINEINIISNLRHPNIVLYMGASIKRDNYYMVTEYLPKGSLFDYIHREKGKFTEKEQINIAFEIAIAIRYLHSRNIVHCDLKSSNILIDDSPNKIKIGDFGLSSLVDRSNPEENSGKMGTPHWMAPEVLGRHPYDKKKADIYSYGMILWEILNLEIPYYGINPYKLTSLVAEKRIKIVIPEEGHVLIRELIVKCLDHDPSKRPSLDDIVTRLEKVQNLNKYYDDYLEELFDYLS